MAKPGRRRQKQQNYHQFGVRDPYSIASPFEAFLAPLLGLHPQSHRGPVATLSEVEDQRYFHPEQDDRPLRSSRRSSVTPKSLPARGPRAARAKLYSPVNLVMGFPAPRTVAVCIRRKVRDEVLHALKKTGRGSGRPRRYNRNSTIRC